MASFILNQASRDVFYLSEHELDRLLLEDIAFGDVTTRALNIGTQAGQMTFRRRHAGRVSGIAVARRLLAKLDLAVVTHAADGTDVDANTVLLTASGTADALHQGWKVTQNVLEWCSGVAQYMHVMAVAAERINPQVRLACTRKSIPGTKSLAVMAVIHGGGILHRAGTAESVLLFANHRHCCAEPTNWPAMVARLKRAAPEKKIIVEADTIEEARSALGARADIVQLDKFTPDEVQAVQAIHNRMASGSLLSVAGGIDLGNVADYVAAGAGLVVTSAPYYARPADIKVDIQPAQSDKPDRE